MKVNNTVDAPDIWSTWTVCEVADIKWNLFGKMQNPGEKDKNKQSNLWCSLQFYNVGSYVNNPRV